MKQEYLEVGKITNTHGIMGEVRVEPWADSADFLCKFKTHLRGQDPVAHPGGACPGP